MANFNWKQIAEMEKAAAKIMTKEQKAQSEQRAYDFNQALLIKRNAERATALLNPGAALKNAFEEAARGAKAELDKFSAKLAVNPSYALEWAGDGLFEAAATFDLCTGLAAECAHESFMPELLAKQLTREAMRHAASHSNSTNPTSNMMERAKGRIFAKLAFADGFTNLVQIDRFYMTPVQFCELAVAYRNADDQARVALLAK